MTSTDFRNSLTFHNNFILSYNVIWLFIVLICINRISHFVVSSSSSGDSELILILRILVIRSVWISFWKSGFFRDREGFSLNPSESIWIQYFYQYIWTVEFFPHSPHCPKPSPPPSFSHAAAPTYAAPHRYHCPPRRWVLPHHSTPSLI
jgi:hypothetical protein